MHHVRLIRLELTRLAAPDPKSGVSTNSTTSAWFTNAKIKLLSDTTKEMPCLFSLGYCDVLVPHFPYRAILPFGLSRLIDWLMPFDRLARAKNTHVGFIGKKRQEG